MLDNREVNAILEKLENLDDEAMAVNLLKEFNLASSRLGKLLLNLDNSLSHDEWKVECDRAQDELDRIVKKINDI